LSGDNLDDFIYIWRIIYSPPDEKNVYYEYCRELKGGSGVLTVRYHDDTETTKSEQWRKRRRRMSIAELKPSHDGASS